MDGIVFVLTSLAKPPLFDDVASLQLAADEFDCPEALVEDFGVLLHQL